MSAQSGSAIRERPIPHHFVRVVMKASRAQNAAAPHESGVFALGGGLSPRSRYGWAVVPKTLADDGGPLDVLVVEAGPTAPGEVVSGEIVGGLLLRLGERDQHQPERNERRVIVISAAPASGPPSAEALERLQTFVVAAGEAAGRSVQIEGWEDAGYAAEAVQRASTAYQSLRA